MGKGGTSNAAVGQSWLARDWIRPIPAPTSASRSPSSQDPPAHSPGWTYPPLPRPPLPWQVPGLPRRGSLPSPGEPQIPPQCPLAGRASRDPGHPPAQLFTPLPALRGGGCPPPAPCAPETRRPPTALPGGVWGTAANNETRRHGEAPTPPAATPSPRLPPEPPQKTCGKEPASLHPGHGGSGSGRGRVSCPRGLPLSRRGCFPKDQLLPGVGGPGAGDKARRDDPLPPA